MTEMSESAGKDGAQTFTPMEIARNDLFTVKEKLELLHQLKAKGTGITEIGAPVGFSPEEIEAAIEDVRLSAQVGESPFTHQGENRP